MQRAERGCNSNWSANLGEPGEIEGVSEPTSPSPVVVVPSVVRGGHDEAGQEDDVERLDRLMTTEEAAELLNVSYSWLKKAAQRGDVPCTHIGRAVRFSHAHVHAIVEAGETQFIQTRRRSSARTRL